MTQLKVLQAGESRVLDVRDRYPVQPNTAVAKARNFAWLKGDAVHHDGVIMEPGDHDYSGSTLDEDPERLDVIYRVCIERGWGGFCYHAVASPNGRTFYTQSVGNYGAHVARRNHELLGLALLGDFTFHPPGQAQLCAAGLGLITLWHLTGRLLDTRGHREFAMPSWPTTCPGDTWWT